MKIKILLIFCILLLISNKSIAGYEYVCTNGNAERVISIYYENEDTNAPCEVQYDKGKGAETLWRAQSNIDFCESKANELVEKQVTLGWSCNKALRSDQGNDLFTNLY